VRRGDASRALVDKNISGRAPVYHLSGRRPPFPDELQMPAHCGISVAKTLSKFAGRCGKQGQRARNRR